MYAIARRYHPPALQAAMLKLEAAQPAEGSAVADARQYVARAAYMEDTAKFALDLIRRAVPAKADGAALRIWENLPSLPASAPTSGA